jgi:hypothetical protein
MILTKNQIKAYKFIITSGGRCGGVSCDDCGRICQSSTYKSIHPYTFSSYETIMETAKSILSQYYNFKKKLKLWKGLKGEYTYEH